MTCYALYRATAAIRAGDGHTTNRMFRARLLAQGFTLLAMCAGSIYWKQDRDKRKEFEALIEEKKAKEKKVAWIRELEARDREEKELLAKKAAMRAGKGVANSIIDDKEKRRSILEIIGELRFGGSS